MLILTIVATCIAIIPLAISFTLPNYYLSDKQNAVDEVALDGEASSIDSTTKTEKV